MLNELHDLNSSMEGAGIARQSWHKDYKACPNNKTFFLLISDQATICDLEPINDVERIQRLRKYEVANGISFPAFNIRPLLHARSERARNALKELKAGLISKSKEIDEEERVRRYEELWQVCDNLWLTPEIDRITKCLQSAGLKDKLRETMRSVPCDYSALPELLKRAEVLTGEDMQRFLKSKLKQHILSSQPAGDWIDALLVSAAKNPKKISIVLELIDRSSFSYPANHDAVSAWVNSQLMKETMPHMVPSTANQVDAFGKLLRDKDSDETFPAVNLPVVGKVILRAMSSESPCQRRYGRVDAKSFPACQEERQAMKDALEWLCEKARSGRTWADASGACGFIKRDGKKVPVSGVFLIYPSCLAEDPPELAGIFFRPDEALDPDGARFEKAAQRVTSALKILVNELPNVEVRVFVLAKADKARTKVLVSKRYTAPELIAGAREWQYGSQNIPPIRLNVGTNDKPKWIEPVAPFPGEVVKCLNVVWLQIGAKTDLVHRLAIGEGVELLLSTGPPGRRVVEKALHLAVVNASPVMLALAHADHLRDGSLKLDSRYSRDTELLPRVLGLLLYKQHIMKGAYMHTAPFLVGRLLALADLLHKEYCKHVRQGDTPPQLIGNALMSGAAGNPVKGLARLRERIMVYQAWANTAKGEGLGLAKWAVGQMGSVASELTELEVPDRTDDAQKAQMLLGYLARLEGGGREKDSDLPVASDKEVQDVR